MNMKKVFAGFMAGAVAVSAMATMAVSAKNELTFTQDQSEFTKTWDFTATKFPVQWKGVATSNYSEGNDGTAAVPSSAVKTIAFTGGTIKITATGLAQKFTLANGGADTSDATFAVDTLTVNVLDASTTTVADVLANINALTGFAATATYDIGANPATVVLTDAELTAAAGDSNFIPAKAATPSTSTLVYADGVKSSLTIQLFSKYEANAYKDLLDVDAVTMKVTGYVNSTEKDSNGLIVTKKTLTSKEFKLAYNKELKIWYIGQVAKGDVTSDGWIDLTYFDGGIKSYDLSYTITNKEKQKKSDAEKLADDTFKAYADVNVSNPSDVALRAFQNSFDYELNNAQTIDTTKGTVLSSEIVHGVTFTGLNMDTIESVKGNAYRGYNVATGEIGPVTYGTGYLGVVSKQDAIYYLGNPNSTTSSVTGRTDSIVAWDGSSSYINSYKKAITSDIAFTEKDDAKNYLNAYVTNNDERNTPIKDVAWNNMLKEIQSLIGDAKGATITFGVYSAGSTDEGRGNDKFNRDTDAPLASTAKATDFALAVNTNASNKFYSDTNLADGKLTMNWDDITQGLAAGTMLDPAIRIAAGKEFVIDSLTVNVPAKTLSDLTVGEGTTGSEESLGGEASSEAAPSSEAASSEAPATTSPATGNAPIALAAIPVALAAAVVVAKKRK